MAAPLSSHGRSVLGLSRNGPRSPAGRPPTGPTRTSNSRAQTARYSGVSRPSSRANEEDLLRRLHEKRIRIQRELAETDAALDDAASALTGPPSRGSTRRSVRTAYGERDNDDAVRAHCDAVPGFAARQGPLTRAIRCSGRRRASTRRKTTAPPWCRRWTARCRRHPHRAVRCEAGEERPLGRLGGRSRFAHAAGALTRKSVDGGFLGNGAQNVQRHGLQGAPGKPPGKPPGPRGMRSPCRSL